jgi:16S rRNA (guanine527-N7)-methyltransferase
VKLPATFMDDAGRLGVTLDAAALARFERLGTELVEWNQRLNLTAIDDPARIVTHHFLDSLSAAPRLHGTTIADVGTGGGFPGLPLAIARPDARFTLIDSVQKKLRFVDHAARVLGLTNVTTRHARVEHLAPEPFDTVITRAFAPLPRLARWVQPLCNPHTRVIAMKGRWPEPPPRDAKPGARDEADETLPRGWNIVSVTRVEVPGLDAERHLVELRSGQPAGG